MVSVPKLLGGIRDVLRDSFYVPRQKERVVVLSFSMTLPSPFTGALSVDLGSDFVFGGAPGSPGGSFQSEKPSTVDEIRTSSHSLSFKAYALSWAITRDSLLSENITTQE